MIIHTIGYVGHTPASFLTRLQEAGIQTLVDVRWTPISHKPGFSKTALAGHLNNAGIAYGHERMLGAPKALRTELVATGDYERFFWDYASAIMVEQHAAERLVRLVEEGRRICLMCAEKDASRCHRSETARVVAGWIDEHWDSNGTVQIVHL